MNTYNDLFIATFESKSGKIIYRNIEAYNMADAINKAIDINNKSDLLLLDVEFKRRIMKKGNMFWLGLDTKEAAHYFIAHSYAGWPYGYLRSFPKKRRSAIMEEVKKQDLFIYEREIDSLLDLL